MALVAHPGGWWELLIPLVIGFGLVFSFMLRRAREGNDTGHRESTPPPRQPSRKK